MKKSLVTLFAGLFALTLPGAAHASHDNGNGDNQDHREGRDTPSLNAGIHLTVSPDFVKKGRNKKIEKHHGSHGQGRGAPTPEAGIGLAVLLGGLAWAKRKRAQRRPE